MNVSVAWRITLFYVLLAGLWIIFSDRLIVLFVADPLQITNWQTVKGWLFVVLSAALLYGMVRYEMRARTRAEEELRIQKSLLECQSEAAPDGILVVSSDREWLSFNQRFVEMWGLAENVVATRSSAVALQSVLDTLVDPQQFLTSVLQLYNDKEQTSHDEVALKDGRIFERYSAPVKSNNGIHYGRVWYYRDISERKRAEEELRLAYERMSNVLESISDAFFSLDDDWNFVYVNREAERMLRSTRTELVGRNIWQEFPDAVGTSFYAIYHQVRAQQAPIMFEAFYPPFDTWFEVKAYPAKEGLSVYFRDTTVRRRVAARQETQFAVTRVLAESDTPLEAVPRLLQVICEGEGWDIGQMWRVDTGAGVLRWDGIWHQPALQASAFTAASRDVTFTRDSGLVGQVWASGKPAWLSAGASEDAFLQVAFAAKLVVHAALAFPVLRRSDVTGVMLFFSRDMRPPDDDLLVIMTDIGSQIGQFMERKRAEEALIWESEVNASMADLSRKLISLASLEDISALVLEHAKRLTNSPFGFVGYIDPQTGYLVCPTMTRDIWDTCQVRGKKVVFETFSGLWGWVLKQREPLLTNAPADDPRSSGTPLGHVPIERFLSVPAMIGGTLLGQISLANANRDYTAQDLELIERLTSLYALAVQREWDEDSVRRYAERLRYMREIDRAILSARSPAEIAGAVLIHLQDLVSYQQASITLFDADMDTAVVLAAYANGEIQTDISEQLPPDIFHDMSTLWDRQYSLVDDLLAREARSAFDEYQLAQGIRAYINVPLISQGTLIGALLVGAATPGAFNIQDLEVTHEVADQLAIAIQQARLFEQVRDGRARLQMLSRRLVEVQETERRHIARELHDEIGQTLTGLHLVLEMIIRSPGEHQRGLKDAQSLVSDLMARVRELSLDLRPAMLDDLGLLPTLRWHLVRYMKQTNIKVLFKHTGLERRFASEVETAVYRLVQEALTNVARHAKVNELIVRLWADYDTLKVLIEDHGVGFDPAAALASNASSGLAGMYERILLLGGDLTIESRPGDGTRLTAELPIAQTVEADV